MENQNYAEWLVSLKSGDEVQVKRNRDLQIGKVERVTATLIILSSGRRFKRKCGYLYGGSSWGFECIEPVTQEARDTVERDRLAAWVRRLEKPSLAVLRAMKAAHDEAVKAEAGK